VVLINKNNGLCGWCVGAGKERVKNTDMRWLGIGLYPTSDSQFWISQCRMPPRSWGALRRFTRQARDASFQRRSRFLFCEQI